MHRGRAVDDAHAVRSDDVQPMSLDRLAQRAFAFHSRAPAFLEPRGDDHQVLDAALRAGFDFVEHEIAIDGKDREVDSVGQLGNRGDAVKPIHGRVLRVDGEDRAGKPTPLEVPQNLSSDGPHLGACADHGDGARGEQRLKHSGHVPSSPSREAT